MAEIAAAAEVSKMTVFNYFPTKEDLVMGPMEQHLDEPARVVRERAPGTSAVAALREHFLAALAAFDPASGLNDDRTVLDVVRLVHRTPALATRATAAFGREAQALLTRRTARPGPGPRRAHRPGRRCPTARHPAGPDHREPAPDAGRRARRPRPAGGPRPRPPRLRPRRAGDRRLLRRRLLREWAHHDPPGGAAAWTSRCSRGTAPLCPPTPTGCTPTSARTASRCWSSPARTGATR
ncbi:TetR/AcrR family transcriptional regulator [Kitasatospora sp. NPDC001660]